MSHASGNSRTQKAAQVTVAGLLLCALCGVFVGASGYTFYYANGTSYLSNDPRACVNCHIMRDHFDGWQKGGHHSFATCNDCHVPHTFVRKYLIKAEQGYRHSKGFTLQDFHEPIQIKETSSGVLQENCVECHREFVSEIIGRTRSERDEVRCVHCHGHVGHGPVR